MQNQSIIFLTPYDLEITGATLAAMHQAFSHGDRSHIRIAAKGAEHALRMASRRMPRPTGKSRPAPFIHEYIPSEEYPGCTFMTLRGGLRVLVDDSDLPAITPYRWHVTGPSTHPYAARYHAGRDATMHRLLLSPSADMVVDHINGNTLDNRRSNLRTVMARDNSRNRVADRRIAELESEIGRLRGAIVA